jgi:hypothetical protein
MSRSTLCTLLVLLLSAAAWAKGNPERTQFSRDIRVEVGEKTGDVTCINCSVYVLGEAAGEVTAIHGNVVVENGASVAGDITSVWGNVRLENGSRVAGDLTAVAGVVHRESQTSVSGDVTSLEGSKWLLAILVPPLVFFGLLVALVVWLLQRNRGTAPSPAYPGAGQSVNSRA